jgi:hypothetical protein
MSAREVSDHSQQVADSEGNPEFPISYGWLTQVENSDAIPGIHKLYSPRIIYRINITDGRRFRRSLYGRGSRLSHRSAGLLVCGTRAFAGAGTLDMADTFSRCVPRSSISEFK